MEVIAAPEYRGGAAPVSSSIIRRCLAEGRTEEAARALGAPYSITGRVTEGNRLGRTLGFPTANMIPPSAERLIPKAGAYAAYVTTPDGVRRPGVVNVGYRPTVSDAAGGERQISIEAHIIDFVGYIYDEEIKVEFVKYLRPERRFADTDKLASQIKDDIASARKVLREQ